MLQKAEANLQRQTLTTLRKNTLSKHIGKQCNKERHHLNLFPAENPLIQCF